MKFVCKGLDLNDALSKVIKACSTKGVGTVLEGVKLVAENGTLTLTATDLELAIEKTITAEIFEEGEALVPGKLFSEFVRRLTNMNVECLLTEKNQLRISYGESTGLISCYNVLEFPNFKKIENAEYFQLKQKDLKDIISKTLVSVALDDSKPVFKGVLFEVEEKSLTAVSLDGFRLSKIEKPITKSTAQTSAIIPSRSLTEIHKLLEDTDAGVKIKIQKNYLMAELKETVILTRLIDGDFINYKRIIPQNQSAKVTLNREHFEEAIERASLLSRIERSNIIKLEITDGQIVITSNSERGEIKEVVTAKTNKNDLSIAFNAKYLLDAIKNMPEGFVEMSLETKVDPCIIRPEGDGDYLYLILPVRLA